MNVLTLQQLERNAYRTLGLPASATQVQIDAAARTLRLTAGEAPGGVPWFQTLDTRTRILLKVILLLMGAAVAIAYIVKT